ncbi:hypothetical protein [Glycomyces harbinensis]|uniref:Uncharacterized protein n=1 Tax=Glycomyces harbinensis TaxID=58114 RepID=A0A1G6Z762_9ACTN|nr:hypothetical protein [Glycomyces harbinensis]SDD97807.1 hypothetical protein SAMN05216270_11063 [Glycomyces harbinensis]
MTIDPHDDDRAVAEAFASLKAESAAHFPPPPVNDLIMRGPAALRRRRLVSLAAVVGACTAVTAGGFAVAQTLGPLSGGPESPDAGSAAVGDATSEESPSAWPGDPASPGMSGGESTVSTPPPPADDLEALIVSGPFEGDWADSCEEGAQAADFESWEITAETGWSIVGVTEGDADGDGENDTILALRCDELIGVAAFTMEEDADEGPVLASFGWVWQPDGEHELTAVTSVEDGIVAVEGLDGAEAAWTADYEWDAEEELFVLVDDGATAEPTADESSSSSTPSETPTTDAGTSAGTSSSGS